MVVKSKSWQMSQWHVCPMYKFGLMRWWSKEIQNITYRIACERFQIQGSYDQNGFHWILLSRIFLFVEDSNFKKAIQSQWVPLNTTLLIKE